MSQAEEAIEKVECPQGSFDLIKKGDEYYARRKGENGVEAVQVKRWEGNYIVNFPSWDDHYSIPNPEIYFLDDGEKKRIQFMAPRILAEKVDALAEWEGKSRSEMIRNILQERIHEELERASDWWDEYLWNKQEEII